MRILAIDYGHKRIGLAICDKLEIVAQPLMVIENTNDGNAAEIITQIAKARDTGEIVIGLPERTDAKIESEHDSPAGIVQRFANCLRERIDIPIVFFNEAFTTKIAERALLEANVSRAQRKQTIDKIAAAILLENYLETRRQKKAP